jgi:hypothetical protein
MIKINDIIKTFGGVYMFFANIKLKPSLLRYLAISISITGVLFIILASFIGNFALRLFAIGAIIAFSYNIKANYRYSGKLKRIADVMSLIGAIVVLLYPKFLMIVMGITILYISVDALVHMIKAKVYKDRVKLLISIAGLIFSIFCIFFSKGTMNLIIRLLGALMMAIGCVLFYQYIQKTRKIDKSEMIEFKFDDNSDEEDADEEI